MKKPQNRMKVKYVIKIYIAGIKRDTEHRNSLSRPFLFSYIYRDRHFSHIACFFVCFQGGNHFDQYDEGQLELEQASLDKPIEPVRSRPSPRAIGLGPRLIVCESG